MRKFSESTVVVSWGQILSLTASILVGVWTLIAWSSSGTTTEITYLRQDISEGREVVRELNSRIQNMEATLRSEFQALTVSTSVTNEGIKSLVKSGDATDTKLSNLENRMMASVDRQQSFERFVITRLGAIGISNENRIGEIKEPNERPPSAVQREIMEALSTRADPLERWFELLDGESETPLPIRPPK